MIYVVLHGETLWNRERRFQGRLDSPLTPEGIAQAHRAGTALKRMLDGTGPFTITSSPLARTVRTAEIICIELGLSLEALTTDRRLMEIDLGSWSGLTREQVEARRPEELKGSNRHNWYFRCPDGEPLDRITTRLRSWFEDVKRSAEPVVAVTHGVASRILRGLYADLPLEAALSLEISREAIFRLADGAIERLGV
jgi:broad specificity phosphatase PhoE